MDLYSTPVRTARSLFELDPRTKLLVLFTMGIFMLGSGVRGLVGFVVQQGLALLSLALLLIARKWRVAVIYVVVYVASLGLVYGVMPRLAGLSAYLTLMVGGIVLRVVPSVVAAVYLMSTTTVSEFIAGMQRMHVSEKITIPLSVMFRMFPTLADEARSINAAMRMRGVTFAGGNPVAMLEYRVVPLLMCTAKIGEELSAAALTRGLGGEVKRTNMCEIGFSWVDVVVSVICAVPFVVAILQCVAIVP